MSETATLRTFCTKISGHDTGYKNGISSTYLTEADANEKAEAYNNSSWRSDSDGEMSVELTEKTVYRGVLDPDSVRESSLSDNVIAHYDLAKDGYDAPATVNSMTESEIPEEAWFVWYNGGFVIADRFGEIQE